MCSEQLQKLQNCRDMLQKCIEQTEDAINKTELEFLQLVSLAEGEKAANAPKPSPPVELEDVKVINAKRLLLTNDNVIIKHSDDEEFDSED